MSHKIKLDSFGNISGTVDGDSVLAVELTIPSAKTISLISCSFRKSKAGSGFTEGAVAVFKGKVDELPINFDIAAIEGTKRLEYLRFFKTEEGFSETVYITADKTENVCVVLLCPYLDGAQQAEFGTLNVSGAFANERSLFEVGR